jgi:serine/threonine-protein kinase
MNDHESTSDADTITASIDDVDPSRFEKRGHLGEGGMGIVQLAFDRLMRREVAVKTLRDGLRGSDEHRQFMCEARLTGQLEHGNIVPVYDLVTVDAQQSPSLVMKYVDGETYHQMIQRFHVSPSHQLLYDALRVFLRVCDAISFAHERGVIHCDLKPENVMVGKHGQVHVMDWGVAIDRGETNSTPGVSEPKGGSSTSRTDKRLFGTLGYMAPEQLEGEHGAIDVTTDIYGLGGVLCVLITGQPPRQGVEDLADTQWAPSFEERQGSFAMPPELCRIAQRALTPIQADRFQSVGELQAEMEAFMAGGGWFETQHYLAGDVIIREGDVGSEAFIITKGVCEVFKDRSDGSQKLIRSMGPGETFGELAVLTSRPRSASVVAQTDVSLRVVTPDALEHELQRNPVLAAFLSAVTNRFCDLEARFDAENE